MDDWLDKLGTLSHAWPQPLFFWLVAAWVKSRAERPSVSVVNRQLHVQIGCKLGIRNRHAWPQPHQLRSLQVTRVSAQAFEAARVSAAVKHLWPGLRPQWTTIYSTLRLEWPGVYDPSVLHGKFFDNVGQSDHTQDSQYQGNYWWQGRPSLAKPESRCINRLKNGPAHGSFD